LSCLSGITESLNRFKQTYGLRAFVETGCCEGRGLRVATDLRFEFLYSCDVNPDYVNLCRQHFPAAHLSVAESVEWLQSTVPALPGPALFWLDAHFPDYFGHGRTFDPSKTPAFPVQQEVDILADRPHGVILVDDLRCYPEFGRLGEIPEHFHAMFPFEHLVRRLEENYLYDSSLAGYGEGVGVFLPKLRIG
jgi:hypothetical protein